MDGKLKQKNESSVKRESDAQHKRDKKESETVEEINQ